jgi:peroxin-3
VSDVSTADLPSASGSLAEDDGKSLQSFKSESYVHASQLAESVDAGQKLKPPKKTKVVLWNEVKISSISRAFTLLYTVALLTLLTRIQLNLLGRRNYLASVVTLAASTSQGPKIQLENRDDDGLENSYGNDFDTNRKYLSFSWWLLHRGCNDIMNKVVQAVQEVFGPINPREELTLERLSALAVEVRKKIEGATQEERLYVAFEPVDYADRTEKCDGFPSSSRPPRTKSTCSKRPAWSARPTSPAPPPPPSAA